MSSLHIFNKLIKNRDNFKKIRVGSVGIAMGYGMDGRGISVLFPVGVRDFFFSTAYGPRF
jgi:hypothetical protein